MRKGRIGIEFLKYLLRARELPDGVSPFGDSGRFALSAVSSELQKVLSDIFLREKLAEELGIPLEEMELFSEFLLGDSTLQGKF